MIITETERTTLRTALHAAAGRLERGYPAGAPDAELVAMLREAWALLLDPDEVTRAAEMRAQLAARRGDGAVLSPQESYTGVR